MEYRIAGRDLKEIIRTVERGSWESVECGVSSVEKQEAPSEHSTLNTLHSPDLPESVPPELEEIVLKAMAKDKGKRYATVMDLHEEVQRFLEGEKVCRIR